MIDREALTDALDDEQRIADPDFDDYTIEVNSANFAVIYQAAISLLAHLENSTPNQDVYLEQRRNDEMRAALGHGRYAPWEQDIERLLNRCDSILGFVKD